MVKDIKEKSVTVQGPDKQLREIPYGVIVWVCCVLLYSKIVAQYH